MLESYTARGRSQVTSTLLLLYGVACRFSGSELQTERHTDSSAAGCVRITMSTFKSLLHQGHGLLLPFHHDLHSGNEMTERLSTSLFNTQDISCIWTQSLVPLKCYNTHTCGFIRLSGGGFKYHTCSLNFRVNIIVIAAQ